MSTANDFLIKKLEALTSKYEFIQIRYEFKEYTCAHLIEIDSLDHWDDSVIKQLKKELKKEFIQLYPLDGILFVTENSLTQIGKAQCVFTGLLYEKAQSQFAYAVFEERERLSLIDECYSGDEFQVSGNKSIRLTLVQNNIPKQSIKISNEPIYY